MSRYARNLVLMIVCLATPPSLALDIDSPPRGVFADDWYALLIQGHKSGHMHSTLERLTHSGKDVIRSVTDMTLTAGRGQEGITVTVRQQSMETLAGEPLSFSVDLKMSLFNKNVSGVFKDNKVVVTTRQLGQTTTATYDAPAGAMMGWALLREQVKQGLKPGTKYTLSMYDPMTAEDRAIKATVEVGEKEKLDLFGRTVEATRTEQVVHIGGLLGEASTTTWVDSEGTAVKMQMSMMNIPFEMLACSKPVALSKDDPSDLMDKTLVTAQGKIDPDARSIRYRITSTGEGRKSLAQIPQTSIQKVLGRDGAAILVQVTRFSAGPTTRPAPLSDKDATQYLAASPLLNHKDPEVAKLAKEAGGDEKDPHKLMDKLRTFVSEHINKKNLSVGFASASEVARSREGDCTEHGVLLAALGRAHGLPTRLVTGLVYAPEFNGRQGVFVGHLWTQFYIDGMWIDQDAALDQADVDPTHIALAVTAATGNGVPDLVGSLWLTLGQLEITALPENAATAPSNTPDK